MGKKGNREKDLARWYEKLVSTRRGGHHRGGPGEPDYVRGRDQGEVKYWSRPMSKFDVMREVKKGRTEIVSREGFTRQAIDYVERYRKGRVRLYHRGKRVV
ncbi:hypothetical protein [Infirmifilum sp.]|jgi:hypothetical protein|uniref:hypothetical protein n=1 Tax=Infirmifilum sp. TaxID=2856575 RepID=UPI003D153149